MGLPTAPASKTTPVICGLSEPRQPRPPQGRTGPTGRARARGEEGGESSAAGEGGCAWTAVVPSLPGSPQPCCKDPTLWWGGPRASGHAGQPSQHRPAPAQARDLHSSRVADPARAAQRGGSSSSLRGRACCFQPLHPGEVGHLETDG